MRAPESKSVRPAGNGNGGHRRRRR
jgi:hypothetical protein